MRVQMIGPRLGRWDIEGDPPMGSATNAIIGNHEERIPAA